MSTTLLTNKCYTLTVQAKEDVSIFVCLSLVDTQSIASRLQAIYYIYVKGTEALEMKRTDVPTK